MTRKAGFALISGLALTCGGVAGADVIALGSFAPPDLETAATTSDVVVGGVSDSSDDGSLEINGGSVVQTLNPAPFGNIGLGAGSTGEVTVTGAGSEWRLEGRDPAGFGAGLTIGRSGTGFLEISDGGRVVIDSLDHDSNRPANDDESFFQLGRNPGSQGTVTISGAGSELLINDAFALGFIGRRSDGTMNVVDGGQLTFSGINTDLNVASDLDTVTAARGALNVNTGGSVTGALFLNVGGQPGSVGTLNLDGAGSTISLSGSCVAPCPDSFANLGGGAFLSVGAGEGTGVVNVTNGAVLSIDSTAAPGAEFPGFNLGGDRVLGPMGNGTMTVAGAGSQVLVQGDQPFFAVGRLENGTGTLNVLDGGQVVMADTVANADGAIGFVGDRPGATGTIVIGGATSLLDAGSFLGVGVDDRDPAVDAGNGTVTLRDGGTLKVDEIVVGAGGTIDGNGAVIGSSTANTTLVQNRGTVAPGLSVGMLSFDGDLILDGGTLIFEALAPGDLDLIEVAGDLILRGGVIEVLLGFTPDPFAPLQFITAGNVIIEDGGLDAITVLALGGSGVQIGAPILIGLGTEVFEAAVAAAVPLPASLWMMLASLAGLAAWRRPRWRRRPVATDVVCGC